MSWRYKCSLNLNRVASAVFCFHSLAFALSTGCFSFNCCVKQICLWGFGDIKYLTGTSALVILHVTENINSIFGEVEIAASTGLEDADDMVLVIKCAASSWGSSMENMLNPCVPQLPNFM